MIVPTVATLSRLVIAGRYVLLPVESRQPARRLVRRTLLIECKRVPIAGPTPI